VRESGWGGGVKEKSPQSVRESPWENGSERERARARERKIATARV